jgi:ankyrin repeat protein
VAAMEGHAEAMGALIGGDADVNARDREGYRPLDVAKDKTVKDLLERNSGRRWRVPGWIPKWLY